MTVVAYETNPTNSLASLKTSIFALLSANGWDVSGDNVSKGSLTLNMLVTGLNNLERLAIQGTVAGVQAPSAAYMLAGKMRNRDIVWPATYHIAVYSNPDLVMVSLNHDSVYWQHMIFGQAISLGLPGDGTTIPFFWATFHQPVGDGTDFVCLTNGPYAGTYNLHECFPFQHSEGQWPVNTYAGFAFVDAPVNYGKTANYPAYKWVPHTAASGRTDSQPSITCSGDWPDGTMIIAHRQPNLWNGDNVFAPFRAAVSRPDGFDSWAFEIPHIRLARNDFYDPAEQVTKGTDVWLILPGRRRNPELRWNDAPVNQFDESGTIAIAMLKSDT